MTFVPALAIETAGKINGMMRPPGSKSITNRALVCAALAQGTSQLRGCLKSEDTLVMIECLRQLGIKILESNDHTSLEVTGCAGAIPASQAKLLVANSGTTIRFLTALSALGHGEFQLDGITRMRQRPIGDLIAALRQLGVVATADQDNQFPPVTVVGDGIPGGEATLRADISSQFLSGLLLAAPYAQSPITIQLEGPLVSQPYVKMTLAVIHAFGGVVAHRNLDTFAIDAPQRYSATQFEIEPDASAASYFWAAAAISGGTVTVPGLSYNALQGDVAFCRCMEQMGCQVTEDSNSLRVIGGQLRGIEVDMADISDTVPTLAVIAMFAEGSTNITGVGHIRHKESDRIGDLARELRKLGAAVDEHPDGLTIHPGKLIGASIATYNDHRMAMSFAIAGLKIEGIQIEDPDCVSKTYPEFFSDLKSLTAK